MSAGGAGERRTLPLSVYQRRYWSKWAQNPRSSTFNTSVVFAISGELDREALKRACQLVLRGHEILHATFSRDGAQQYSRELGIEDVYTELAGVDAGAVERELMQILDRPYDLETGPLCRFHLLDCGDRQYYFVAGAHHVIVDAASARIFVSSIMAAYAAALDRTRALTPVRYAYADSVEALHAPLTPAREAAARAFWKALLHGAPLTVAFPRKDRPAPEDWSAESIHFELDGPTAAALKRFAKENTSTLFIVLFALYGCLLSRYARQATVVVSYPVNMRPAGHAHVIGCFINLLVKKVVVGPDTTFRTLVADLTQQQRDAKPHTSCQLGSLVHERGDVRADIERSFFSVFFGETHLQGRPLALGNLRVEVPRIPWSQEFDRELRLLYDASDGHTIQCRMDYRTTLFDRELILRFIEDLRQLAGRLVDDARPLCQITG